MFRSAYGIFRTASRVTVISSRKAHTPKPKFLSRDVLRKVAAGVALATILSHEVSFELKKCDCPTPPPQVFQRQISKDVADLVEKTSPAVVQIWAFETEPGYSTSGTGFFVDKGGLIVTNCHVVKKQDTRVLVKAADNNFYCGKVLSCDEKLDLALIRIPGTTKEFPTIELGDSYKVRRNDFVTAIRCLDKTEPRVMSGVVECTDRDFQSSGLTYLLGVHPEKEIVYISQVPVLGGASGSPVINQNGEAIGVLYASRSSHLGNRCTKNFICYHIVFSTSSNSVKNFLNEAKKQVREQEHNTYLPNLVTRSCCWLHLYKIRCMNVPAGKGPDGTSKNDKDENSGKPVDEGPYEISKYDDGERLRRKFFGI